MLNFLSYAMRAIFWGLVLLLAHGALGGWVLGMALALGGWLALGSINARS